MRSTSLANTTDQWETFSTDPLIIPAQKHGCALQYNRIFADANQDNIYLSFWYCDYSASPSFYSMQLWKLMPNTGPLPIVASYVAPAQTVTSASGVASSFNMSVDMWRGRLV